MSNDEAPAPLPKKSKRMRWLAATALLFIAWFCWQLLGPDPPIVVSKETTYITAPLSSDGLPDYQKYMRDKLHDGVTSENNAAVLLWQALGGSGEEQELDQSAIWATELGMKQAPTEAECIPWLYGNANREAVATWFKNRGGLNSAHPDADLLEENVYEVIGAAMGGPWTTSEIPPLADWLQKNRQHIDMLVEASQRDRWYWSLRTYGVDEFDGWFSNSIEGVQILREAARVLMTRAFWHLGEGRIDEASRDVLAIHRLARLISQQGMETNQLIGIAVEGIARDANLALLADARFSKARAKQFEREFNALPEFSSLAKTYDDDERAELLHFLTMCSSAKLSSIMSRLGIEEDGWHRSLNLISVDWNIILRQANEFFDRIARACELHDWQQRRIAFEQINKDRSRQWLRSSSPRAWASSLLSRRARSELVAGMLLPKLIGSFSAAEATTDRANSEIALNRVAIALAIYRADHGQYPEKLDQLVPTVLPQLPVDLYHSKPFVYQRDADGYLLYCTGENGVDDGGSNEYLTVLAGRASYDLDESSEELSKQIPAGADDIAIRVPRPPFTLPTPTVAR